MRIIGTVLFGLFITVVFYLGIFTLICKGVEHELKYKTIKKSVQEYIKD